MRIGDRVEVIKGNQFGKIGIIIFKRPHGDPVVFKEDPTGLKKLTHHLYTIKAEDDGTTFGADEDQLDMFD